jgi:hypothetical protein
MDVSVDEPRGDDPICDDGDLKGRVLGRDLGKGAERDDDTVVVDDKQAIRQKPGRFLFPADVLPGVVDEVEELSTDSRGDDDRAFRGRRT